MKASAAVANSVLQLANATVVKDERPVLDGLTLTIDADEHTAILGPNGAGKSALVRLLTPRQIAPCCVAVRRALDRWQRQRLDLWGDV